MTTQSIALILDIVGHVVPVLVDVYEALVSNEDVSSEIKDRINAHLISLEGLAAKLNDADQAALDEAISLKDGI